MVTDEERATFEAIRQKMLADQDDAIQTFAVLAASQEATDLFYAIGQLRDRCVVGSNEHVMLGNIVSVFTNVKGQYPVKQTAPALLPE